MTEPNEPSTSDEPVDVAEASDAIEFTDPPSPIDDAEPDAAPEPESPEPAEPADSETDASPVFEDEAAPEVAAEPVTLPDESNSRTSELAARLRQSALAQVEAARAARSAGSDSPHTETPKAGAAASSPIPALDDPRPAPRDAEPEPEPTLEPAPVSERLSEPLAVAAAAVAEAQATGNQSFLSGPQEPGPSRVASPMRLATIAVAALALAAVVVLVVFARSSAHHHAVDKAGAAALAAAKPEVAAALTYDYRTLDSDFAKAETGMSTKFKANYARTAASSVTPLATSTQAISTGTVAEAGVISASTSTVRVLVFADQTAQNKQLGDKSRLDRSVIEVTMVKQGGRWVIDGLKPF